MNKSINEFKTCSVFTTKNTVTTDMSNQYNNSIDLDSIVSYFYYKN